MQWLIDIVKAWIEAQGYLLTSFVDRGDPAAYDFTKLTLTSDGTWHVMDLSAIVPAGAKAVTLRSDLWNADVGIHLRMRTLGNTNLYNVSSAITQVAGIIIYNDHIIPLDTDRKIEYIMPSTTWIAVNITVKGWWL